MDWEKIKLSFVPLTGISHRRGAEGVDDRRLELGFFQREVAKNIGTTVTIIFRWESNETSSSTG